MNRRFLFALAAAALCGLLAIFIAQSILINKAKTAGIQDEVQVVFAKVKIPANTPITEGQLDYGQIKKTMFAEGLFTDKKMLIGKFANTDLEPKMQIQARNISTLGNGSLGAQLDKDKRAMTIRVDEASSVAGFASSGNFVDVIAVLTPGGNARPISKVIAQNLKVIANGRITQAKPEDQARVGSTVTLEVTPTQAAGLTLAMREGILHLILRNPTNKEIETPIDVISDNYLSEVRVKATPVPATNFPLLPSPTPRGDPTPRPTITPSPSPKMIAIKVIEAGNKETTQMVKQ